MFRQEVLQKALAISNLTLDRPGTSHPTVTMFPAVPPIQTITSPSNIQQLDLVEEPASQQTIQTQDCVYSLINL
ncbi:unnamed protein product [Acanthoscelides obtectus]|uniref:Uncharacterized protein n=1 Tax=Acanthoscelides obtectus TaxID=200917 RepID=A0A9P0KTD1_ACAOB|nr:unnamed protein product [Acanthoscelides obtectus]CAK1681850.1 hypothetical protein AOBTE_LOCUS33311 [Acanthoscelides obtectus]